MVDLNKRYWLFDYSRFYPSGGFEDIILTSDALNEVIVAWGRAISDCNYIFDRVKGKIILANAEADKELRRNLENYLAVKT